jgi:hypothetical protein
MIGNRATEAKTCDMFLISKNTPFDYSGNMKLLLIDSPPF